MVTSKFHIYDYTCICHIHPKFVLIKLKIRLSLQKAHHPSLLLKRTVAKGHQGCNKVMARCHWASLAKAKATLLRLTIFTWSNFAPFPQSTMTQVLGLSISGGLNQSGMKAHIGDTGSLLEISLKYQLLPFIQKTQPVINMSSNYPTSWPQKNCSKWNERWSKCWLLLPPWLWILKFTHEIGILTINKKKMKKNNGFSNSSRQKKKKSC